MWYLQIQMGINLLHVAAIFIFKFTYNILLMEKSKKQKRFSKYFFKSESIMKDMKINRTLSLLTDPSVDVLYPSSNILIVYWITIHLKSTAQRLFF